MKIGIISGSHRDPSQSAKVADYIQQQLALSGVETWVFTLANNPLDDCHYGISRSGRMMKAGNPF